MNSSAVDLYAVCIACLMTNHGKGPGSLMVTTNKAKGAVLYVQL